MPKPALETFRLEPNTCIPQAQPKGVESVTLGSPALDVMTDLAVVRAETINPKITLPEAEKVMINRGVRSLFVTANFPCIEGLLTANDILGEKPVKLMSARKVKMNALTVEDVMTDLPELDVLDYNVVKTATVGNLVTTFAKLKCTHLLVVQASTLQGPARLRGVISQTQMERQLAAR